jgi:serine/threonine-protein kinase HipA
VDIGSAPCGQLVHESQYTFAYRSDSPAQRRVGFLMPADRQLVYSDTALFPAMDQNLPEGYLFRQP